MEIVINEKKTQVKYGFKALMYYERIMGQTFQGGGLNEVIMIFYCCYMAGCEDAITFNEFVDWLDDNPNDLAEFTQYLTQKITVSEQLTKDDKETGKEPTKKERTAKKK